ncbi:MAG: DJ-1/PfpI family protein [Kiritimatiellae bacterium]|nr:DJ-1/PfpI family protein [Kiritimatiellia bacterium]
MPRVLIPLATGVEEMEATIIIDTLRRARWDVTAVGMSGKGPVTGSRAVKIMPDAEWGQVDPNAYDMIVIPGGAGGVENLRRDKRLLAVLRTFAEQDKWLAAVCSGPLVLQEAGLLKGKKITSHPAIANRLTDAKRLNDRVVIDGRLVTSQGAGTCFEFALMLITLLAGPGAADTVADGVVFRRP